MKYTWEKKDLKNVQFGFWVIPNDLIEGKTFKEDVTRTYIIGWNSKDDIKNRNSICVADGMVLDFLEVLEKNNLITLTNFVSKLLDIKINNRFIIEDLSNYKFRDNVEIHANIIGIIDTCINTIRYTAPKEDFNGFISSIRFRNKLETKNN